MADSYISGAAAAGTIFGSSNSVTITAPASIVSGNLLVTVLGVIQNPAGLVVTPPSGWSLAGSNAFANAALAVYTKTATGSEPGSYTFSTSTTGSVFLVATVQQHSVTALDGTPTYSAVATGTNPVVFPSITPTSGHTVDTWLTVAIANNGTGSTTFSTPTGFTARDHAGNGSLESTIASFTKLLSSSAATGTANSTFGLTAGSYEGLSILLDGGGGGGSTPPQPQIVMPNFAQQRASSW